MNDLVFKAVEPMPSIDKGLQTSLEILIEKKLDDIFESERFIQLVYKAIEDNFQGLQRPRRTSQRNTKPKRFPSYSVCVLP
jgi:hypothetical protein